MKNLNVKAFVWILVGFSVAAWAVVLFLSGVELKGTWPAIKQLPTVISVDLVLWGVFVKWGWKWRRFQGWLVPFPCLEGTWEGTILSTWKDPQTGSTPPPIPVILVIKQSFVSISCVMHSREMTSRSYSAEFAIDPETNSRRITYTYTSTPRATVRDRSAIHNGTALLDIMLAPSRELRGAYWTDRRTTGEIRLAFKCSRLLEAFPVDPTAVITESAKE
jgi:hypothetical protein